jgi:hypothetical protein
MDNTGFTRITVEVCGRGKVIYELPTNDISIDELCQAFRTIMVGLSYTDETAGDTIASYLAEYYPNRYNIEIKE